MPVTHDIQTVNEVFIEPLTSALGASVHTRPCPELPDVDWLRMGVLSVFESSESGRAFLQEHGLRLENGVNIGTCLWQRQEPAKTPFNCISSWKQEMDLPSRCKADSVTKASFDSTIGAGFEFTPQFR